jgi:hypothetical protein
MLKKAILALSTAILVSGIGYADSKTASSQASLGVLPDCTISATDMDMGIYNSRTGASGTSTVRVKCNSTYVVKYTGYTGTLKKGTDQVNYVLRFSGPSQPAFGNVNVQSNLELTKDGSFQYPGVLNFLNFYYQGGYGQITSPTGDIYSFSGTASIGQWVPAGTYQETVGFVLEFPFNNLCQGLIC